MFVKAIKIETFELRMRQLNALWEKIVSLEK